MMYYLYLYHERQSSELRNVLDYFKSVNSLGAGMICKSDFEESNVQIQIFQNEL
jgi:hypothetical protein